MLECRFGGFQFRFWGVQVPESLEQNASCTLNGSGLQREGFVKSTAKTVNSNSQNEKFQDCCFHRLHMCKVGATLPIETYKKGVLELSILCLTC